MGIAACVVLLGGCVADGFDHTLVMSGTACGLGVEYSSPANVRIRVYSDDEGHLRGLVLGECGLFDEGDDEEWNSCASAHDLHAALWFEGDTVVSDAHAVLELERGVIGARDLGTLETVDHGDGERVAIDDLDLERGEIALRLNLPIETHNANFPPTSDDEARCSDDVVVGSIVGAFEAVAYTD